MGLFMLLIKKERNSLSATSLFFISKQICVIIFLLP